MKHELKKILLFTILAFLVGSIAVGQEEYTNMKITNTDSINTNLLKYAVGADDVLSVKVFDNPDLTGEFIVYTDGSIVFPLLGQVKVTGLGVMEIQEILTKKLKADYLHNPIVSVEIKQFKSKVVYILGNVGKPGAYYLDRPTQLFDMLSKAEGLSHDYGKLNNGLRAHIIRHAIKNQPGITAVSKDTSFVINIYQFLIEGKAELNIFLKERDIIYIPDAKSVHVIGEVKNPGSFPYEEGMTVLKAVTLAGGQTKISSTKNIVIKRIINNKEEKIKVTMGDLLKPDDIIEVPLSIW